MVNLEDDYWRRKQRFKIHLGVPKVGLQFRGEFQSSMDKSNNMLNTGRKIELIIAFLILSILAIGFYSSYRKGNCMSDKIIYIEMEVSDIIVKKFIDPKNHNGKTLITQNNKKLHMVSQLARQIYDVVELGDSLHKMKNSRKLILYKSNGEKKEFIESEPDCDFLLLED